MECFDSGVVRFDVGPKPAGRPEKSRGDHCCCGAAAGEYRERLLIQIAELEDQIGFWTAELAGAQSAGADVWSAETIREGDQIQYWSIEWMTVEKVNPKSLPGSGHPRPAQSSKRCSKAYSSVVP